MRNARLLTITCLTALVSACGGEDLQPVRSAGPALGKRVVYNAETPTTTHVYLADTGAPGTAVHLTRGLLPGPGGTSWVSGMGNPRYISYQEWHNDGSSDSVVIDLEAIGRRLTVGDGGAPEPRVTADGMRLVLRMALPLGAAPHLTTHVLGVAALDASRPITHFAASDNVPERVDAFEITPDGAFVVWVDGERIRARPLADPIPSPSNFRDVATISGLARQLVLGPDSDLVLWLANDRRSIQSARLIGGVPIVLTPGLDTGEAINEFRLSADGTRLVYRATDATGRGRLFVVDLATPGTATELTPAWAEVFGPSIIGALFTASFTSSGWQLRPDGAQVAFRAGGGGSGQTRGLYTVEVAAPGAATLRSVASGSSVGEFGYADGGASLVWTATPHGTLEDSRLWRGPSQGPAAPVSVFGPLTFGADDAIFGMKICGDDTAVVRWIDWVAGAVSTGGTAPRNSADLYSVRTDGSTTAALLTPANTLVEDFACVE